MSVTSQSCECSLLKNLSWWSGVSPCLDPSDGVFGRFALAALCGCHTGGWVQVIKAGESDATRKAGFVMQC